MVDVSTLNPDWLCHRVSLEDRRDMSLPDLGIHVCIANAGNVWAAGF